MADGMGKEQPVIIKKKKGGGHEGHHGGAWKVAYADFVTAMMAFFIVMWILSSGAKVKKEVAAYFKDPGAFSWMTGKRTIPIDLELLPDKGRGEGKGAGTEQIFNFNKKDNDTIPKLNQAIADSIREVQKVKELGESLKETFAELSNQSPDFKELLESVKIEITNEGLRITLVEKKDEYFFEIGSAVLKPKAVELLKKISVEVGKMPNNVEIEGHTDSRGYGKNAAYTNFELSADRANAARRVMQRFGLREKQVSLVTGFADSKLADPTDPFDFSNRRVSILVRNMTTKEFANNPGE